MLVSASGSSARAADWKTASRTLPVTVVRDAGQVRFGLFQPGQQRLRVGHQDLRLRRELDAAAGLAQQFHAGFFLQQRQLLGYR